MCYVCFRQKWDIRASIINAFATLLLLSLVYIVFVVSIDCINQTMLIAHNGSVCFCISLCLNCNKCCRHIINNELYHAAVVCPYTINRIMSSIASILLRSFSSSLGFQVSITFAIMLVLISHPNTGPYLYVLFL